MNLNKQIQNITEKIKHNDELKEKIISSEEMIYQLRSRLNTIDKNMSEVEAALKKETGRQFIRLFTRKNDLLQQEYNKNLTQLKKQKQTHQEQLKETEKNKREYVDAFLNEEELLNEHETLLQKQATNLTKSTKHEREIKHIQEEINRFRGFVNQHNEALVFTSQIRSLIIKQLRRANQLNVSDDFDDAHPFFSDLVQFKGISSTIRKTNDMTDLIEEYNQLLKKLPEKLTFTLHTPKNATRQSVQFAIHELFSDFSTKDTPSLIRTTIRIAKKDLQLIAEKLNSKIKRYEERINNLKAERTSIVSNYINPQ